MGVQQPLGVFVGQHLLLDVVPEHRPVLEAGGGGEVFKNARFLDVSISSRCHPQALAGHRHGNHLSAPPHRGVFVRLGPARKTITFSLSPEMAEQLDEAMQQLGRSRSEFLRDAVLQYIEECEWRQLLQYGEERARARGIGPEDVSGLVESTGPRWASPEHEGGSGANVIVPLLDVAPAQLRSLRPTHQGVPHGAAHGYVAETPLPGLLDLRPVQDSPRGHRQPGGLGCQQPGQPCPRDTQGSPQRPFLGPSGGGCARCCPSPPF